MSPTMLIHNNGPRVALLVLVGSTLLGCPADDKAAGAADSSGKVASAKASGEPAPAGGKLTDQAVDAEDIPTVEDFEDEAVKNVTEENYLDELDKLAGEIEKDK